MLKRNGEVIEMHFGLGLSIPEIADITGLSLSVIDNICSLYNQPITEDITLVSKVNYTTTDWYIYNNWNKLSVQQIAEILAVSTITVKRIAKRLKLKRKTRVVDTPPNVTYRARVWLLNLETGIYYLSEKEAAETIGMNYSTFKNKMNGNRINNTQFIKIK